MSNLHATTIYEQDFSKENGEWQSVLTLLNSSAIPDNPISCWISWLNLYACTVPSSIINGHNEIKSPWWLDENHAPPGAGYLNLLTWTYPKEPIDISNAILELEIATQNLNLKGSKLLFWFQNNAPNGKFANFALTGTPIDVKSDGITRRILLDLSSKKDNWTCLGTSLSRADTYDCMPVEESAKKVDIDFGFIIFPVSSNPDPTLQPTGIIKIKSIKILTSE